VAHGVSVVLEIQGPRLRLDLSDEGRTSRSFDRNVLVDEHAVVPDGHPSGLDDLARGVEARLAKLDVVGLPGERREAHRNLRRGDLVDSPAIIMLRLEPEGVEDLDLVSPLEVDAAIPAVLPSRARSE